MTKELDILIDGVELYCLVDYNYISDNEVDIESIKVKGIEVSDIVPSAELEKVKVACAKDYEYQKYLRFVEREERYNEQWMIEQRDKD